MRIITVLLVAIMLSGCAVYTIDPQKTIGTPIPTLSSDLNAEPTLAPHITLTKGAVFKSIKSVYENVEIVEFLEETGKESTIFVYTDKDTSYDNAKQFFDIAINISLLCNNEFIDAGYDKVKVSFMPNKSFIGVVMLILEPAEDKCEIKDVLIVVPDEEYEKEVKRAASEL